MKKLLLFLVLVVMSAKFTIDLKAQEQPVLAGAGITYATELDGIGLFLKGVYQITPEWEGSASYTYFFKKDMVNWSTVDLNGHYVFFRDDKFAVYGLAGLDLLFWKIEIPYVNYYYALNKSVSSDEYSVGKHKDTGTEVGLNIGVGGRVGLTDQLFLNPEIKYVVGDGDFLGISVGLLYNF